ncbi:MAG TPA: hypothetical protein VG897_08100 [Terriglobales bacterium]|nr:hypothetical protein [Terriglobales bacterium]
MSGIRACHRYALRRTIALAVFAAMFSFRAAAQQPFFTDNADVAAYHHWHFETNNEYDALPFSSRPSVHQDTQTIKFSYGLFRNCEVGMDFPLITIFNTRESRLGTPFGLGDTDFSIKYNFHHEREGSGWPAISASFNFEPPTGDANKQLGSGLTDYYLNSILKKTLSPKTILNVNAGATFAGNTATGVVGIRTRGTILTGGSSVVHQFTEKLDLGMEVYGGYTANLALGRGELQEQIGGNYEAVKNLTIDFGIVAGQAVGSPHYGFILGFSKDF